MKKFLDIESARFEDDEFKTNNVGGFYKGDHIQITEKIDGSNASISWDEESSSLAAFSRKQPLTFNNTLAGFWNFVQTLNSENTPLVEYMRDHPELTVFGEYNLCGNKLKDYEQQYRKDWFVYDIYNANTQRYETQEIVKEFCDNFNLNYIHVLYDGPFIDWNHVQSFLHANTYGPTQEGIVIKNLDRLADAENRMPTYLKIVNDSFKERQKTRVKKEKSADEIEEENRVNALIDAVVTPARVEKMLYKLRDEGILPEKLVPQDMGLVAKNLPKRVFEDLQKEEMEIVVSGGEKFSKAVPSRVMAIARQFIMG